MTDDEFIDPPLTPDQLAEIADHIVGNELINDLLRTRSQAKALPLIHGAIADCADSPPAAAGLAMALLAVLLTGLKNLTRAKSAEGLTP